MFPDCTFLDKSTVNYWFVSPDTLWSKTPDANKGIPKGLCSARKLYYVTTAGGNNVPLEYGYGYVRALAQSYYGIPEVELIQATGLDIEGADIEGILKDAQGELDQLFPMA